MIRSSKTARELYADLRRQPPGGRFGVGRRAALLNIDLQRRYTDKSLPTAYETDPGQIGHVNALARRCRAAGFPVVWAYVAYGEDGSDAGLWATRFDGPLALKHVRHGSAMAELDPRLDRDPADILLHKRMSSAFFETNLTSTLVRLGVDTVIVTGGATSGCVRCTVVDAMQLGFRVLVPEEACADRHESPHFQALYDMATKYADVVPISEALATLDGMARRGDTHAA
jgi:maleamate amidohydrolase